MKIAVVAGYAPSLVNFRGPLLHAMQRAGHEVVAVAPNSDAVVRRRLADRGIALVDVELRRSSVNPLGDLNTLRSLTTILRDLKPDRVLSYTPKPVIWASIAARLARVKGIYALITGLGRAFATHDQLSVRQFALNRVVRFLYRRALSGCDGVFFQNPDDEKLFRTLKLIADLRTTVTAGSGIDLKHFSAAPLTAPPQTIVFLTLTRLLVDKGVPEFVEAATRLRVRYPNVRFRVIGPRESGVGGITDEMLSRWETLGSVEFAGPIEDVREELNNSSVYVLASSYGEGVPRSILEALSTGRAIITTDTPGCRETVVPGKNGWLIPARDSSGLEYAMERFVNRPEQCIEMGHASRQLAESKFDVNMVNQQMLAFMGL